MKTILSIVGARPQFVKLAPFSKVIRNYCQEIIVHTGQHYDSNMSDVFFEQLDIPKPDMNLEIGSGGHGQQTGEMLAKIEKVLLGHKPNAVVVFGDTNSTLAGALAASKLQIPCFHIEAGLRSFNRTMPEELNRVVTDHLSDVLFAPTPTAVTNLKNEGLSEKTILSGDIMVDVIKFAAGRAEQNHSTLNELDLTKNEYLLLTLHRPYTVDSPDKLENLLCHLNQLGKPIVFPIHPRTKQMLRGNFENIRIIPPQGYLDFVSLQLGASKIITDSGGLQKEAFILAKPCITLRSETEWVETVECGWNLLLPPSTADICFHINNFNPIGIPPSIFGADVANKIAKKIDSFLA